MNHEVFQGEAITAIFDKYGLCAETEDLLICRMDKGLGQHGYEQMEHFTPALEAHYGDLAQSDFLRRLVQQNHKTAVARYEKDAVRSAEYLETRRKQIQTPKCLKFNNQR